MSGNVRLFGFDAGYQQRHDDIDLVEGEIVPGDALISVEAAQQLGAVVGDSVTLAVPARPLR